MPLRMGVTFEALPESVVDPYIGFGGGYYVATSAEPIRGLPPQYDQKWAPADMDLGAMPGFYGVLGVDFKFHDYLGVKIEGSYHFVKDSSGDLDDADFSGLMVNLGPWIYF